MPVRDGSSTPTRRETTGGDGQYLIAGALIVAVLVGVYVLIGTPGLYTQVANAPANVESTMHAAPMAPAPAAPAR